MKDIIMFHGSFFDLFSGILEVKDMNMLISVIVGGLVLGCTYGMLSLGYSLIYQASGYMNFTQATLLMFGSFLAWQFLGMGIPFIAALFLAVFTPIAFAGDIILMLLCGLKGGDATSMVSGTALLITCLGALLGFGKQSLEKVTGYVTEGFLFAIRIFAPVIIIGAFFFLGGDGITSIMGERFNRGIMNDWALWLAQNAPLNKYMAAFIQMVVGGLTGLDGSGFSGLPLTGALARTFGTATGSSVPVMAALGQIAAIFVGGGTIVPWGLIPVAAICNVSPLELARKNLIPVCIGFACTFALACFML